MQALTAAIDPVRHKPGAADRSLFAQVSCLLRALAGSSSHRLRLGFLAISLIVVVCAVAYGQIRLNEWNGTLTDTLAQRAFSNLGTEIIAFLVIVCGLLLLVVTQTWLQETIKIRLRERLTHEL